MGWLSRPNAVVVLDDRGREVARAEGSKTDVARALVEGAFAFHDFPLRGLFRICLIYIRHQAQKTVLHLLFGVRGHKGAPPLAAHQQMPGGQFVNRLAHRSLADAKPRRQLHFAGNHLCGLPFALLQAAQDQIPDLLIKRPE